jgi:phosphoribosylformylglycinamidine (FGAM) synthase-like amidotransferase family enzyme
LARLESEDRIAFRYATPEGEITAEANPNGSISNIAGILNEGRNVLGMMPHPDRSSEELLGSADGRGVFESMIGALEKTAG